MLGLQGSASSSKEYRCVACSASFTGLASLLVHQATHASSLPKPPQRPSDNDLVNASPPTLNAEEIQSSLPKSLSPPMYICDCGEEFRAFTAMMDHKQSHDSEGQSIQSVSHELIKKEDSSDTHCEMTVAQTDAVLGEDLTAGPSIDEPSLFKDSAAVVTQEESAAVASTEGQSPVSVEADEQCDKTLSAEEMPEETDVNVMDDTAPKIKPLMKILGLANGKHLVSPPPVDDNSIAMSLKQEPEVVVITPQTTKGPLTDPDMSTMQLKRLLGKPGMKTKAPSISRLLESSTKTIVSLTKIFSPVVLLETRQRFMDPNGDTYGKYQCSRCRRVFQEVDGLTEHHFMHKKERIKCCRCCKQLIIGRVPLPDNHVCPQSGGKTTVSSLSFRSNPTIGQKFVQINNPRKVYFCPICKHNFARRYNLKMHKCCGPQSSQSQHIKSSNNAVCIRIEGSASQSIGVGTQVRSIKVEDNSDLSNASWGSLSSIRKQHDNASAYATSFLQVQDSRWTVPLNNEMEILPNTDKDSSSKFKCLRSSAVFRDGVQRYSCDKCHKTFGLSSNLCRHKKVCSDRPRGLGSRHSSKNSPLDATVPMFSCYVCGKNFNRKDNMMVHRKKCEMRRTMIPDLASEINPSLPPSNASIAAEDQTEEEDGGSWSIMSLPSVLPRRVTCECGIGFTSPKLLLEHLQKHAQESYTCPTCGVTVKSWFDYEIHLQRHMHPQHHKISQPLLLQFKKMLDQPQCQTVNTLPEPASQTQNRLKNQNRKQPFVCPKCGNAFANRCTLRRHMTWSQCSGGEANLSINYNLFSLQQRLSKQI